MFRRVSWGWLGIGVLVGAIAAPKLRAWTSRTGFTLPSYGNGR